MPWNEKGVVTPPDSMRHPPSKPKAVLGFDCVKLFNSQVLSLAILFKKRAPSSNKLKKDHTVYEGIFNHIYDFTIDL